MSMKIVVGDNACFIEDDEVGVGLGMCETPAETRVITSCPFRNSDYAVKKCDYEGHCVFQRKVTQSDVMDYPNLFEEDDEDEDEEN